MRRTLIGSVLAVALVAAACSGGNTDDGSPTSGATEEPTEAAGLPTGGEPVQLDPADFVGTIDHPFWPMSPGSTWTYREVSLDGTVLDVVVTVTGDTKDIQGI